MKTVKEVKKLPELHDSPVSCNSWIIYDKAGLIETYSRRAAFNAWKRGLTVKTAFQHLAELNKEPGAWGSNWKTSKA